MDIYNCARAGDLQGVKNLHLRGADLNIAIIGASQAHHAQIATYCFDHGAHLLFGLSRGDILKFYDRTIHTGKFERNQE